MENNAFYNQPSRQFDEIDELRGRASGPAGSGWKRRDQSQTHPREILDNGSILCNDVWSEPAQPHAVFDYDHMIDRSAGAGWKDEQVDDARWRERLNQTTPSQTQSAAGTSGSARSRYDDYNKQSSSKYRDYGDDHEKKYGQGVEEPSGRRSRRSKSRDRDTRDRDTDRRDRNRCRDRERRNRRDDSGHGNERDDSEYRPRRRSRSRDRDRSDRDRRHRDSDRDRRHRDVDRGATRPYRDHDRDRGDRETSPKEIPWVPPPLPEHLRHLQVQWALTPVVAQQQGSPSLSSTAMRRSLPQNQFQNDGSFMEMFRQRMQQGPASAAPSAKVDDFNVSEGPSMSAASVVAAPVEIPKPPAVAGPSLAANSSGLPVIAKRRISKILKTGIVQKKKKEEEEEEEDKGGDGWSSYMKEVQKYRANKCIENEASRPPLVK